MNDSEINALIEMKKSGMSCRDIVRKTGRSIATVVKYCKGITSLEESRVIRKSKNIPISELTRKKLSDSAKMRIMKTKKVWTSLEQRMFYKFIENGYVVKFNKNIEDSVGVNITEYDIVFQGEIQRYCVDFLDEKNKICYEINGNYWHANPKIYRENLTECQKWNIYRDKNKIDYLESKGYKVIVIWEDEIDSYVLENKNNKLSEEYVSYVERCIKGINHNRYISKSKIKILKDIPKCVDCGCEVKWKTSKTCYKCSQQRKSNNAKFQIDTKTLQTEVETMSLTDIGRKYGVSTTTVKRKCDSYGIYWRKNRARLYQQQIATFT